jgi:hypothetical protein
MATITSNGTGFYDVGGTWVGGIVPVEGDKVIIASGHVVTIRDTRIAGDDTTTAFTITGELKADRTANSQLTVKGDIQMSALTSATINYGRRSTADPIPAGITATLILNYSAAMANYKYGIFIGESANAYFCGATKKRNTTIITAGISAGATSAVVADITGWTVGDWIIFGETTGIMAQFDRVQILTVTPGTGTTGTVTFAATTYAHALGGPVGNFSSNVTIKSHNTTNPAYFCCRLTSTASNNRRELDYTTFEYVGSDVSLTSTKVFVTSGLSTEANPFNTFESCSFYQGNNSIGLFFNQHNTTKIYRDHAFFISASTGAAWYTAAGTYTQLEDSVFYYGTGVFAQSAFSQGGQGATYRRCKFWANGSNFPVNIVNGSGLEFVDCQWHSTEPTGTAFCLLGSGDATFTTCSLGGSDLPGTPATGYVLDAGNVSGQVGTFRFNDCKFATPTTAFYRRLTSANPKHATYIANKNNDPLVQEIYTPNGNIIRDNTSKVSGVTSLKMSPVNATNALTFTLQIPAPTGNLVGVSGILWRDTANTTTVTLSGLGIAPSTYTASGSLSANETFSVSGTNTTGTDGILTLTVSTTGTTGNLWVDAVSAPQAAAINFGEFGFWSGGLPTQLMTASFTSAGDVWNYLASNVNVAGSMGKVVKFIKTLLLIK